jgi:hypothetical protein
VATEVLGSFFRKLTRKCGVIAYDAGNVSTLKMPRGFLYRKIMLRLSGSLNTSSAGTAAGESPLGLIAKLELALDSGKTIVTVPGKDLFRWVHTMHGKVGELLAPTTAVNAAVPFSALLEIPLEAIRKLAPADSFLDTAPYTEIEVKVTWGLLASIYTGGTSAVNASTQLEVGVEQTADPAHASISLLRQITYKDTPVVATQSNLTVDCPPMDLLEGILIHADRDGVADDALINAVSLLTGGQFDIVKEVSWAMLQAAGVQEFQMDGGAASTGRVAGYAYIDLTEDGRLASALGRGATKDLKLIFDVTLGSGTTRTIRSTFIGFENKPN